MFGSEFVALQSARDMIILMCYKLRMFGVPIHGPAQVYCDYQGVVKNTSLPESVLSKKSNAINFHAVREAAAAGVLEVHEEDTQTNLADLFTKVLSADRRRELLGSILYILWQALGFKPLGGASTSLNLIDGRNFCQVVAGHY